MGSVVHLSCCHFSTHFFFLWPFAKATTSSKDQRIPRETRTTRNPIHRRLLLLTSLRFFVSRTGNIEVPRRFLTQLCTYTHVFSCVVVASIWRLKSTNWSESQCSTSERTTGNRPRMQSKLLRVPLINPCHSVASFVIGKTFWIQETWLWPIWMNVLVLWHFRVFLPNACFFECRTQKAHVSRCST